MLCILRLKVQVAYHICLAFMWVSGDLNSGPKACTANTLTPKSQPTHWVSDSPLCCLLAAMTFCCINFPFLTTIQIILLYLATSAGTSPCCPATPGQTPVKSLDKFRQKVDASGVSAATAESSLQRVSSSSCLLRIPVVSCDSDTNPAHLSAADVTLCHAKQTSLSSSGNQFENQNLKTSYT